MLNGLRPIALPGLRRRHVEEFARRQHTQTQVRLGRQLRRLLLDVVDGLGEAPLPDSRLPVGSDAHQRRSTRSTPPPLQLRAGIKKPHH